jgi:5'-phosphate synthase pdxT subunit
MCSQADFDVAYDHRSTVGAPSTRSSASFHPELTADARIHDLAFFENSAAETPPGRGAGEQPN